MKSPASKSRESKINASMSRRFDEQRFDEQPWQEERPEESSLNVEPAPRRAMPASRRPVQKISEPLDVEPIQDDLDDPW